MKVLIVFNHPAPYKVNLFNELNKYIPIDVVFERNVAKNRHQKFYADNEFKFNYKIVNKNLLFNENSINSEIKKIIKNNDYDLIMMNGYSTISELIAINYLNKKNIKWNLFINGGVIKKDSLLKKKIKNHYISSAYSYLSPCKEADDYLLHYGASNNIYHYCNSTVFEKEILDKPLTKKEKDKLKQELNLDLKKTFISPCQFIKRKNNLYLMSIFKDLPDYNLLLIGSGPLLDKYKQYIQKYNLKNIIIIDYLSKNDLFKYYKASDALITLSSEDIYCHTINEAMANGIPVVAASNIVSARHLIKDDVNGFLVDPDNKENIINALNNVSNDMSNECIKTAKENTIEKSAKQIYQLISENKL